MKKRNIIITSIFLPIILFVTISVICKFDFINAIDSFVFKCVHSTRNVVFDYLFTTITLFGESKTIIVLAVVLLLIPKHQKLFLPLIVCLILSTGVNMCMKELIQRARPVGVFLPNPPYNYDMPTSFSFPSGHSQNGFLFYFLLLYVLMRKYFKNHKNKKAIMIASTVVIALIPFSRIYLGVHFFTDVLVGTLLGLLFVFWFMFVFEKYENKFCGRD